MKTLIKVSAVALTLVSLSACSGGDVDVIKETPYFADQTLTTGQALDNRPICTDVSWDTVGSDEYNRPIVEYRCTLKGSGDYFAKTDVVKVEEVFRWSYTDENVFYVYGGLHLTRNDNSVYEKVLLTRENAMNGGTYKMKHVLEEVTKRKYSTYAEGAEYNYFPWMSIYNYKKAANKS